MHYSTEVHLFNNFFYFNDNSKSAKETTMEIQIFLFILTIFFSFSSTPFQ